MEDVGVWCVLLIMVLFQRLLWSGVMVVNKSSSSPESNMRKKNTCTQFAGMVAWLMCSKTVPDLDYIHFIKLTLIKYSLTHTSSKLMFKKKKHVVLYFLLKNTISKAPTMDINAHIHFTHKINWLNVFPIVHDICKLEIWTLSIHGCMYCSSSWKPDRKTSLN